MILRLFLFAAASAISGNCRADTDTLAATRHDVILFGTSLVSLGAQLFQDTALSADRKTSCASCHRPDLYFTDGKPVGIGVFGNPGTRNTPTLLNISSQYSLLWDGRKDSLESQVLDPIFNSREHALKDEKSLLQALRRNSTYAPLLIAAFGTAGKEPAATHVAMALAAYVRSLISANTAFDRYVFERNLDAFSSEEIRGYKLFTGLAGCSQCHNLNPESVSKGIDQFHVSAVGFPLTAKVRMSELMALALSRIKKGELALLRDEISSDSDLSSLGHFLATGNIHDVGKFRTPSLRHVAHTAPYMHDGSIATLDEAIEIELYSSEGAHRHPVQLTADEKIALEKFLKTL